uniref:Uncharacterized protein n=1 Tax=Ficus carica TaxID=3494 RepID=A0AA88EK23_FICCA|nr:hypothetical protein TIFTF001_055264 [Ficus carica]GMN72646.1 hypothetical protein TIFTF001_055265 [Ficus carica]
MAMQIKEINSKINQTAHQVNMRPVRSSQGLATQEISSRIDLGTCPNS